MVEGPSCETVHGAFAFQQHVVGEGHERLVATGKAGLQVFPDASCFTDLIQEIRGPEVGPAGRRGLGIGGFPLHRFILTGEVFPVRYKLPFLPDFADVHAFMPVLLRFFVPVRMILVDVLHALDVLGSPFGDIFRVHVIIIACSCLAVNTYSIKKPIFYMIFSPSTL